MLGSKTIEDDDVSGRMVARSRTVVSQALRFYSKQAWCTMKVGSMHEEGTYIILPPALIEDHVQHDAWKAAVVLNHAHQLTLKLLLLCTQAQTM